MLLHNVHLSGHLMVGVVELLRSLHKEEEQCGRVWLSLDKNSVRSIPKELLQQCLRIVVDAPDVS